MLEAAVLVLLASVKAAIFLIRLLRGVLAWLTPSLTKKLVMMWTVTGYPTLREVEVRLEETRMTMVRRRLRYRGAK